MSILYDLLKKKAEDPITMNQIVYAEMPNSVETSDYRKCIGFTYSEFFKLVNKYVELIKNDPYVTSIVFVDNSVASTALIIAMRKCEIIPVLVDISSKRYLKGREAPHIYRDYQNGVISLLNTLVCKKIIPNVPRDTNADIIICSSGSEEDIPHFSSFREEQLINMKNQYGNPGDTFYSYISSANISGLLTNIVNPLLHGSKAVMRTKFDLTIFDPAKIKKGPEKVAFGEPYFLSSRNAKLVYELFVNNIDNKVVKAVGNSLYIGEDTSKVDLYGNKQEYIGLNLKVGSLDELGISIDELMMPRDIEDFLEDYDCSNLDFSLIKHMYLAGGVNSSKMVDKIKGKIPSLPNGVITNLYGATEAGGVICSCRENDFIPCYVDCNNCLEGKIIYTFDKINFYSITNGKVEKVDATFNEDAFIEYLPVSSELVQGVSISDDFTISFSDVEGKNTIASTDIGAYIDGKLYVFGRKSSLVNIEGKNYFMAAVEASIARKLGTNCYCHLTQDGNITLFVDCRGKSLKYKLDMYKRALDICNTSSSPKIINYPILLDINSFPKIEISGKMARAQFDIYLSHAGSQHLNVQLGKYVKDDLFKRIVQNYFSKYDLSYTEAPYQIKFRVSDDFFFPINDALKLFDVVSLDDTSGEMTLEFNDNYMFDIGTVNLLLGHPQIAGYTDVTTTIGKLLIDGVDRMTRNAIEEYDYPAHAYRNIDPSMTSEEIIRQLRINVAVSLYYWLPPDIRDFVIKGSDIVMMEMFKNGKSEEEVKEIYARAKNLMKIGNLKGYEEYCRHIVDTQVTAPESNDFER